MGEGRSKDECAVDPRGFPSMFLGNEAKLTLCFFPSPATYNHTMLPRMNPAFLHPPAKSNQSTRRAVLHALRSH
jgi:hypothetical protein